MVPEQVCSCHVEDVLWQPAYMLFYARCQPRPSLPDLARRAAALASSGSQSMLPPLPASPLLASPAMRSVGPPPHSGPPSMPDQEPTTVEAEGMRHAGGGGSSSNNGGADLRAVRKTGLHVHGLSSGKGPVACANGSALGSQEMGVFEGRGLCRGEPADESAVPLHFAKAH